MGERKIKPLALELISKYRNEIYGFGILWIMLFHSIGELQLDYTFGYAFLKPVQAIIGGGNIGVEIFLFCSGVFLYFSYHRNPSILSFMKKRISRLFWPVLLINGLYWAWIWIFEKHNPATFISKISMLDFWLSGDQQIWFVACIFICYLLYPYVYAYLFESKFVNSWIRLLLLLGVVAILTLSLQNGYPEIYNKLEIAVTRFPVFLIGCFAGKFVYEKKTLPGWSYGVFLLLDVIVVCVLQMDVLSGAWHRWFYMIGGISVTFTVILFFQLLKWKPTQSFFSFFGKISLNLYVSHILMIRLYEMTPFFENKNLLHYLVILVISVVIAWLAELVITRLQRRSYG